MSCYNSRCQEKSQGNPAKMFMSSKFKLQQYGNGNDQVEIRWEMDSSVLHTSISEPSSPLFQSLSHLLLPLEFKESPKMFYLWRRVPAGGDCVIFLALGVLPNQGAKRSHNKVVFLIAHTFPKLCAEHSRPFSSPVQHIHKQHKSGSRAVQEVTSTA